MMTLCLFLDAIMTGQKLTDQRDEKLIPPMLVCVSKK